MRTAVDSSVLLDVLQGHPEFGEPSRKALRRAYDAGALVECDIVWAEVRGPFPSTEAFLRSLETLGVRFDTTSPEASATAFLAGEPQEDQGNEGERLVVDFLVGAHALHQADALLTRDGGFYRRYFEGLRVIDPTER